MIAVPQALDSSGVGIAGGASDRVRPLVLHLKPSAKAPRIDRLRAARGLVVGLMLAMPFWLLVLCAVLMR